MLDASEIPPTFGASPEMVQGIIAGGVGALHRSAEGAEDEAGRWRAGDRRARRDRRGYRLRNQRERKDSFRARRAGGGEETRRANDLADLQSGARSADEAFDLEIDLATGPEILTGSTRLKAGTATKIALNILSTGAMVALGKVRGNLMIDLAITNKKLRDRAARLVAELGKCDYAEACERLQKNGWNLRAALG